MQQLGFNKSWIQWIMSCVSSVSYSVLINGSLYGSITTQCGLRQGDPISQYLFLFCADMLTQRLRQEEFQKNIKGRAISNFGPRISHSLFVDDSLLFCHANHRHSQSLAHILQLYGEGSGQQVNLEKSSKTFGSRVFEAKQQTVKQHSNF